MIGNIHRQFRSKLVAMFRGPGVDKRVIRIRSARDLEALLRGAGGIAGGAVKGAAVRNGYRR